MNTAPPAVEKILIVDDKPSNLLALEAVLENLGHTLIRAHSGRQALDLIENHDFSVILLDVQMPEMDGFEVAELIRKQCEDWSSPIIFITAMSSNEENLKKGYKCGGLDFLVKPFSADILRSKVKILVGMNQTAIKIKNENGELKILNAGLSSRKAKYLEALEKCGEDLAQSQRELETLQNANAS